MAFRETEAEIFTIFLVDVLEIKKKKFIIVITIYINVNDSWELKSINKDIVLDRLITARRW